MIEDIPRWLEWGREIQALSQTGIHYATDDYNHARYRRLEEISAEIISAHCDMDYGEILKVFQDQVGYATPRVDVRGAVFRDGKLLLVKERDDKDWTMPGGWVDVGDSPSQAVEREVWEEAGFRVEARKVIGVYDANRIVPLTIFHAFKVVFLCDLISGEAKTSCETSEVAFFDLKEIPDNLSGERTKKRHIHDAFNSHNDSTITSVFD